jgi:hypothetical protein
MLLDRESLAISWTCATQEFDVNIICIYVIVTYIYLMKELACLTQYLQTLCGGH